MKNFWSVFVIFLFGLGANLYVQVVGYLAFSEVALVLVAPVMMFFAWSDIWKSSVRIALLLAGLWLLAAIISDQINGTFVELALRGWARPIFIAAAILVMYRLLKPDPKLLQWFFLGLALSNTIGMYAFKPGSIDMTEQIYDVTIEGSFEKQIIEIVVALACFGMIRFGGRRPYLVGFAITLIGGASVFLGSRSAGALLALAGVIETAAFALLPVQSGRFRMNGKHVALIVGSTAVAALLVFEAYALAAGSGVLGDKARDKYQVQSGSRFGVLVGGRLDFLGGVLAVADRPVVGHGSWPLDSKGYLLEAAQLANVELDQSYATALERSYVRIPTHSHLLETWVEHGVLSTIFWWYVLWTMVRCATRGAFVRPDLVAAAIVLLLLKSWDFFFSPIGLRVALGAIIAFFILLNEEADRQSRQAARVPRIWRQPRVSAGRQREPQR